MPKAISQSFTEEGVFLARFNHELLLCTINHFDAITTSVDDGHFSALRFNASFPSVFPGKRLSQSTTIRSERKKYLGTYVIFYITYQRGVSRAPRNNSFSIFFNFSQNILLPHTMQCTNVNVCRYVWWNGSVDSERFGVWEHSLTTSSNGNVTG